MESFFPINRTNVDNYPNLEKVFQKDLCNDFSSKQIFRLLDNLHFDGVKILVDFIEMFLSKEKYVEFIIQKIKTKDYTQFSSNIMEIILLDFLLKKGFDVYTFDNNKSDKPVPEYYVNNSTTEMLIELYSPFELYGFETFLNELRTAIKYFPNDLGFSCIMEIKCNKKDKEWERIATVPFDLNIKYSNDKLRHIVINNITTKLFHHPEIEKQETFYLTDNIYISVAIKFNKNYNNREITDSTPGYDSVRKYVSIQKDSKGFYRKLLHKINSGQFTNSEYTSAYKVLFVDFSHSMGSEVLVAGMGEDFLSKTFYDNLSQRLTDDVLTENVDLIFPIICKMNDEFIIGNCVYNPHNIDVQNVFNTN